jgi:hypothetical protein
MDRYQCNASYYIITDIRKGKSQIWVSKIWSRVPRDSDPRKTTLARASSMYKRQTLPLVREGAPQKQDRNCQMVINIWTETYWLTISRSVTSTWLDLTWRDEVVRVVEVENRAVVESEVKGRASRRRPARVWSLELESSLRNWQSRNKGKKGN